MFPSSSVRTPTRRLFTRFLKLLPTNESAIEQLLAYVDSETRERITSAYPGYPGADAYIQLGGDFAFGSAAWQIARNTGSTHPTSVYRYDYAPRLALVGSGRHHGTELLAVFGIYRTKFGSALTAAMDGLRLFASARRCRAGGGSVTRTGARTGWFIPARRAAGQRCSIEHPDRSSTHIRTAAKAWRISLAAR